MVKRLFLILAMGAAVSSANAQYQVANGNFEEWERVTYKKTFGSLTGDEPKYWSSFVDATGSMKNLGAAVQLYKSEEVREGASGLCAKLTSRSVAGVVAQGNLTNGCVNMGSMSATDAKTNYNYINAERTDQAMRFSGFPDAMKIWVRFSGVGKGNVNTILTTQGYYQDPLANTDNDEAWAVAIANATNKTIASNDTWTQYTINFDYANGVRVRPYYVFINISTSAVPGQGAAADYMYVDDIEMIYNSSLKSATYNGSEVEFNGTDAIVDAPYDESKLVLTSDGVGATIEKSFNASTAVLTITVKGDNISEDASNYHTYTIQFQKPVTAKMVVNSAAKWGTFVAPFDVEIPAGVNAYTVTDAADNGLLTLSPVTSIKANTPVVLESEDGVDRTPQGYVVEGDPSEGLLKGVYVDTPVTSGYVLQNLGGRVGFYQVNGSITVPANRAYLNTTSNVKGFYFETATGIDRVESLEKKDEMYDLSGRRVKNATKGVYIVNGKKVLK